MILINGPPREGGMKAKFVHTQVRSGLVMVNAAVWLAPSDVIVTLVSVNNPMTPFSW